jgi:hypothetical protein
MTTRDIQREHEKLSRTHQVRERLGPIVSRLKASLAKMESLDESMNRAGLFDPQQDSLPLPVSTNSEQLLRSTLLRSGKSREVMHGSMELVKRKLLRLQHMEELLAASEERRHNLQHQVLQVALSKPQLELAATKRQNAQLQRQVEKATTRDQEEEESKTQQEEELARLQVSLHQTSGERDRLKEDLLDRQAKINEQAIRCDDLECQVEHMKIVCDEMLASLKQLEDRNAILEQELLETQKMAHHERFHPRTIHCENGKQASVAELTVSTSSAESTCRGDDNSFDSSYTMSSASITAYSTSDHASHSHDTSSRPKASPVGLGNDDHKSMIETLMATIEVMDRENAVLREEKHHFIGKCKAQQHEMTRQAKIIRDLEQRLGMASTVREGGEKAAVKQTMVRDDGRGGEEDKGSFFHRFMLNSNVGRELLANNNQK